VRFDLGEITKLARLEIIYSEKRCLPLEYAYLKISENGADWYTIPGSLPDAWRISALGEQPKSGRFVEPFLGQAARYIDLVFFPKDACFGNFLKTVVTGYK